MHNVTTLYKPLQHTTLQPVYKTIEHSTTLEKQTYIVLTHIENVFTNKHNSTQLYTTVHNSTQVYTTNQQLCTNQENSTKLYTTPYNSTRLKQHFAICLQKALQTQNATQPYETNVTNFT